MSSPFLDQYDSLDIIGNGSFGVIRKVRRKVDGEIFARKELNFERMTERDRKQIVAEVNILKDLHHDHIVRYHDRYVDREAGVLYILMEYCGGGDLSTVIKQSMKQNRPIPEDTIWNYFMQILLALHHCHHPNGHGRSGSGGGIPGLDVEGKDRRAQILHRDLKPDNVFLDENGAVKLGDFGLSKALAQASFANTYVGTPYYMSPELMQEKAYDSKSDIWSLGCLIYELCALKPPFHEAKTHSELSIFIRNGRIPPLPRGYSQALSGVIKAMLNLNPAMRPSATQLLQHERLELVFKVAETEKMLSAVKNHKSNVVTKERELAAREQDLLAKEQQISDLLSQKDNEIANLQNIVAQLQQQAQFSQQDVELAVRQGIARREEDLRVLVRKREEEVGAAMAKREEEIMEAVRQREIEVCEAWSAREAEIRKEVEDSIKAVEERVAWVDQRESELKEEEEQVQSAQRELETKLKKWEEGLAKSRKEKAPLEEVKNLLEPLARLTQETPYQSRRRANNQPTPQMSLKPHLFPTLATPATRQNLDEVMVSAMKGVVLTATGETLTTPAPSQLTKLFDSSPKVGLNFCKIFDFDGEEHERGGDVEDSPPPSPSMRKERERTGSREDPNIATSAAPASPTEASSSSAPPTRLRRPSIRKSNSLPTSTSDSSGQVINTSSSSSAPQPYTNPKPLPHPHLTNGSSSRTTVSCSNRVVFPASRPSPEYDLADEENLPSPFLKRTEKAAGRVSIPPLSGGSTSTGSAPAKGSIKAKKRPTSGNVLRAVAAANSAGRRATPLDTPTHETDGSARPSLASARKASEEARKALSRP